MNQVLAFVVWAALLVMPTLLVFKNLPEIRSNERPLLAGFSELLLDRLPAQKGVVLSDDFRELLFAEAAASRAG